MAIVIVVASTAIEVMISRVWSHAGVGEVHVADEFARLESLITSMRLSNEDLESELEVLEIQNALWSSKLLTAKMRLARIEDAASMRTNRWHTFVSNLVSNQAMAQM